MCRMNNLTLTAQYLRTHKGNLKNEYNYFVDLGRKKEEREKEMIVLKEHEMEFHNGRRYNSETEKHIYCIIYRHTQTNRQIG